MGGGRLVWMVGFDGLGFWFRLLWGVFYGSRRRFMFLLYGFPLDGSASYNTQVCFRSSCTNIAVDKMQTLEFRALNPAQPATPTKSKLQAHHHEQHASNTVISKSHNHNIACFKIPLSHPAPSTTFTSTSVTAFSKSLRTHSKGGLS